MDGGEGVVDNHIGHFRTDLDITTEIMTNMILEPKKDGTTNRTWADRVDQASEYPYKTVNFSEDPFIDPDVDLTLIRAEENAKINAIWSAGLNRLIKSADRKAATTLTLPTSDFAFLLFQYQIWLLTLPV